MICNKCGAPLEANSAFCVHCGTPVQPAAPAAPAYAPPAYQYPPVQNPQQPQQNVPGTGYPQTPGYAPNQGYAPAPAKAPMDPAKKKKLFLFGGIGLGVVALVVILIIVLGGNGIGFSSATDAAEGYLQAYASHDIEALMDCVPDFMIRDLAVEVGLDENASRSDVAKRAKIMMPSSGKTDIKIIAAMIEEFGSPDDYRILNNSYFDYLYPEDRAKITEVAIVEVVFMYEGDQETAEIMCIKMDGKWYGVDMD